MFSSIQNAKIIVLIRASWGQNQNGEEPPFRQKKCMVFSFILQNNESKLKLFWKKRGTKHPLDMYTVFI